MSEPTDSSIVYCRHLLICRHIWYDLERPNDGFSLGKLMIGIEPVDGEGYPIRISRLFLYAQVFGTPGEYLFRYRLVRIENNDWGEEFEVQLGPNGEPSEFISSLPLVVSGEELVDQIAVPLTDVAFRETGLYEFQLWLENSPDEPIASERIQVRE